MSNTRWVIVWEETQKKNPTLMAWVTQQEAEQVALESNQREIKRTQEKTRAEQNVTALTPLIKEAHACYRQAKRRATEEKEQNQCHEECHRQTNLEHLADNRCKDKKKHARNSASRHPPVEKTLTTKMPPAPVPTELVQIRCAQLDSETIRDQSL